MAPLAMQCAPSLQLVLARDVTVSPGNEFGIDCAAARQEVKSGKATDFLQPAVAER